MWCVFFVVNTVFDPPTSSQTKGAWGRTSLGILAREVGGLLFAEELHYKVFIISMLYPRVLQSDT